MITKSPENLRESRLQRLANYNSQKNGVGGKDQRSATGFPMKSVTWDPEKQAPSSSDYYGAPPDAGFGYGAAKCTGCSKVMAIRLKPRDMGIVPKGTPIVSENSQPAIYESSFCPECGNELEVVSELKGFMPSVDKSITYGKCSVHGEQVTANSNGKEKCGFCTACGQPVNAIEASFTQFIPFLEKAPEKIAANQVSMQLFNKDSKDPHWVIMLSGDPYAKVTLSEQSRPDEIRPMFVSESYRDTVLEALTKMPSSQVFASIKAKVYSTVIDKESLAGSIKDRLLKEGNKKIHRMVERHKSCLNLAIEASYKNYDIDNPLKAAICQTLIDFGIDNAHRHVEASFKIGFKPFIDKIFALAEKYSKMSDEGLEHFATLLRESSVRLPEDVIAESSSDGITANFQPEIVISNTEEQDLKHRLTNGNFPIRIQGSRDNAPASLKDDIRGKLHLNKKMYMIEELDEEK